MRVRSGLALGGLAAVVALLHLGLLEGLQPGAPGRVEAAPALPPAASPVAVGVVPMPSPAVTPPPTAAPDAAPPPRSIEAPPAPGPRPPPRAMPRRAVDEAHAERVAVLDPATAGVMPVAREAEALPAGPPAEVAPAGAAPLTAPPRVDPSSPLAQDAALAPALPPLPVYRTRIPAAAHIVYRLSRGPLYGSGELDWRVEAGGYQLRLEGKLPLIGTLITQASRGRLDAAGLAPERHTDQRLRRSEQAANFQRDQGRVSFSGGARPVPLAPGLQDRLSVMVQLAAVVAAGPQPPPADQALSIGVVGVRGDAAVWVLRYEGVQAIETPDGPVKAWRYLRQPDSPHDTVAEFWLDPARQFLPVRVKLTDGSGEALELRLESHQP